MEKHPEFVSIEELLPPSLFQNISEASKLFQSEVNDSSYLTWAQVILSIILGLIVLITIFGNVFVLFDFCTRARLNLKSLSPTHFFIANLSLSDFLVGILVLPFLAVWQVNGKWYFGQEFCTAWVCIHFWLCSSSILSTCSVCIERYIGVKYPIYHMRVLNRKRIALMILGVWTLAGIPSIIRVFAWTQPIMQEENGHYKCKENQKLGHSIIASVFVLYIPELIMMIFYWQIYKITIKHIKALKIGLNGPDGLRLNRSQRKSEPLPFDQQKISLALSSSSMGNLNEETGSKIDLRKYSAGDIKRFKSSSSLLSVEERQVMLAKKLFFLVGIVIFCYTPYFTLILIRSLYPGLVEDKLFHFFVWLRYFNSCVNPFIYAYAVPAYSKSFSRVSVLIKQRFSFL